MGRLEEARKHVERGNELKNQGKSFEATRAYEEAEDNYKNYIRLNVGNTLSLEVGQAQYELGRLYETGALDQPNEIFERSPSLYHSAALNGYVKGRYAHARMLIKGEANGGVNYQKAEKQYFLVKNKYSFEDISTQVERLPLLIDSKLDKCINLLDKDIDFPRTDEEKAKAATVSALTTNLKDQGHEFIQGQITKEDFASQAIQSIRETRKVYEAGSYPDAFLINLARAASAILTVLSGGKLNEYFGKSSLGLLSVFVKEVVASFIKFPTSLSHPY